VEAAITLYTQTHRSPAYTTPLAMSDWYSLFPDEQGCVDTRHRWPDKFPNAGRAGVYLIFDSGMSLLYVGMTTRDLNRRLGDYFGYIAGRGSGCLVKGNMLPPWKVRPYYVRTIPLLHPEEAPFLEAYLIRTLKPPENSRP
jgi:excinuclease UvrABC nuclease subunit